MRFGPGDDASAEGGLYRLLMALALIRRAGFGQALALDVAIVLALAGVTEWRVCDRPPRRPRRPGAPPPAPPPPLPPPPPSHAPPPLRVLVPCVADEVHRRPPLL